MIPQKQTRISYYRSDFQWHRGKWPDNSVGSLLPLVLQLPSVWRRDSRWRWRRSRVAPECFPVGSLQSSCSRSESCPRCKQNHETLFVIRDIGATQWPNACMTGCCVLINLPELLFAAHELDESVLIGLAPLQLQSGAVDYVRLQKQTSGFLVQPVLWRGVFLHDDSDAQIGKDWEPDPDLVRPSRWQREYTYAQVDVFKDFLDGAVLPDEVDGPFGADPLDGAAVVAAQQNAEVYEL